MSCQNDCQKFAIKLIFDRRMKSVPLIHTFLKLA